MTMPGFGYTGGGTDMEWLEKRRQWRMIDKQLINNDLPIINTEYTEVDISAAGDVNYLEDNRKRMKPHANHDSHNDCHSADSDALLLDGACVHL
jgi:hypothetical protein